MLGGLGGYIIYIALLMIIPIWAQSKVKNTYNKYSKKATSSQMTGAQVARKILDDNGLYNISIEETKGMLSDHYDPRKKVVRLSTGNFHGQSMASSAVAAHEVGHAIQDAEEYAFLRFRSALVPVASFGSNISFFLILAGIFLQMSNLLLFGIIFMSAAVLFQLVTLPVEFDASSRAMTQLVSTGVIRNNEERETKKVLNAAAMTYVAAALVAVAELVRFILIYFAGNND
ncbi:zinc metallopeptidase [Virgibacillus halodenitrificans]|uniref:Zinc metallopeptidase n=2 Tax=Virgibacillus halodenitrificans TaxID=1482 RepID=A0ABR7VLJ6_VIRHA|nr:zinc metallopeptidase [Virgibacillus halodenitrificans]MBD1222596.1 zinc metallopeptidase [Virgibacillus halodenitrificans]MCG1028319.1 zinc metallopeptidase [Virgibacillus halodenitrificans]MEC2160408.1 zinc metallopeptidase [Virgibacillus halodenitrificans]MYL45276.1 zinc metallopeptidase [Virgibacillus halodenitrificans]MYL56877.1 zinc metallopeptidase [Virgibacillus halodenitrificans]